MKESCNEGVDERTLYIRALRNLYFVRANGQHQRLLHLRSVEDDTGTCIDKKHRCCKPDESQWSCNVQSILVAHLGGAGEKLDGASGRFRGKSAYS